MMELAKDDEAIGSRGRKAVSVVVVIPFYNGSDFIERAVRSVLEQTVRPSEFIVVDDGSRPEEADKLDEIAALLEFRVVRQKNGGQGSARNAGVRASASDFICFLDQDDFYLRNHIEVLIEALPNDDPHFGWVYGDLFEADRDGNIVSTRIASIHSTHPKTSIFEMIRRDMHVLPSAAMIAREAFEAVEGFDSQFMGYEDDDLFLRIFRKGFTNYFIDRAVTVWCIHTESTSYGVRMARSRLRYFKKLAATFPDEPEKGRFYMRDYLVPRFRKPIIDEAIAAVSNGSGKFREFRDEYVLFAEEFEAAVQANPYVRSVLKLRLRVTIFLLKKKFIGPFVKLKPVASFAYLRLRRLVG